MATLIDPRQFEHPYISISDLCFLFQLKRAPLLAHLGRNGIQPARALNGELFGTGPRRFLYAASEVVFALPPSTRGIFLAWQRGDFVLPPFNGPTVEPAPFSELRMAPVGTRGGRPAKGA